MRLFRLFALMDSLRRRRGPVTAKDLSQEHRVSVRSIYRDIADLQAMGAPIRGEGGIGYVLDRGYFMPSLHFEEGELDVLMLGLRLVEERSGPELGHSAQEALAKLSSSIGEEKRDLWLRTPLVAGPSAAGARARETAFYAQLRDGIKRHRVLKLHYESVSGKMSERFAHPLGMTVFEAGWLLTIWCETAGDFRHLRMDRIRAVEDAERAFRPERGRSFAEALAREAEKTAPNGN
ncbi:MAG: YafY family transcriptional regulator [Silicimonas sp.]|nr:YafY family transcriptional regulator [Silicimonas sp.]